jgi:hypothetical protein
LTLLSFLPTVSWLKHAHPPCAIRPPITHDAEWMERAVGAHGSFVGMDWGVAPGWYEPGLWPKVYAMPQSLSLVGIS